MNDMTGMLTIENDRNNLINLMERLIISASNAVMKSANTLLIIIINDK